MVEYIIIGAGSAGCVLANRLSADSRVSVLLLEAGGADRAKAIHIPAAFNQTFQTALDWNYMTEPQPCMNGRRLYWPRGKMLGGSSSMNAMIYIRGNRADYDHWAAMGCEGWGYEAVLPYFKKSEHQERLTSAYHGVGGLLNVADQRCPNPMSEMFIEAGMLLGYPKNDDFNGGDQIGVGLYQVTQKRGKRHSAAAAFLKPVLRRPNLTVETHAHVTRILFEGTRAIGVEFIQRGHKKRVRAKREVLLAGGAVNSPQLLMLSGIGDGEELRKLNIPVIVDLPDVGKNLQDHLICGVLFYAREKISLINASRVDNIARYLFRRTGPLTSIVAEAGGFICVHADLPDLQFHFAPVIFDNHGLEPPTEHGYSVGVTLINPRSVGYLKLRSADPFAPPVIQPNYLTEESDSRTLETGMNIAREIGNSTAFQSVRREEYLPGASVTGSDAIRETIRNKSQTLYHPVGTCTMGAVVGTDLRVKGVEGLRVVDASVMPQIIRGNTNAPTIMIAEKAADLIVRADL